MSGPLAGFEREAFTYDGRTHDVYRAGTGPAVIVIHEIPNLHPGVVDFGRRLVAAGYTAYLPSLFGEPGAPITGRAVATSIARVCVSREFTMLADRASRVTTWLRALAAKAHAECGGRGVGAVGMCLTGNFALAMAVDPVLVAPVLSQPGIPVRPSRIGLAADQKQAVWQRTRDGLCLLGLRFTNDRACPPQRFATMRREFGDAFEEIEIDSSPGNPAGIRSNAHAVLTVELVDRPGHPTRAALDRVLDFLAERLDPQGSDRER
jgi:dienelactone hydrolase